MYHVMIYSADFDDHYAHPYAVHLFKYERLSYERAFSEAEWLLDEHFPSWREDTYAWPLTPPIRFVGIERLPVPPAEGVVLAKFERKLEDADEVLHLAEVIEMRPLPDEVKKVILQHRLSQLTLDLDWVSPSFLHRTLVALGKLPVGSPRVYKTYRGYHIRAPLPEPASDILEMIEMRMKANDDLERCRVDQLYVQAGYPYLANLLFNEKAWREDDGRLLSYTEQPVDPSTIHASYTRSLGYQAPQFSIEALGGRFWTEGDQLRAEGPFLYETFYEFTERLKASPPLKEAGEMAELRRKLKDAYLEISPLLGAAVERCEVTKENGLVYVKVPREQSKMVGRLIGRGGCNIRTAEAKLGLPIRLIQEEVPEEVEMRKRLKRLLGEVA